MTPRPVLGGAASAVVALCLALALVLTTGGGAPTRSPAPPPTEVDVPRAEALPDREAAGDLRCAGASACAAWTVPLASGGRGVAATLTDDGGVVAIDASGVHVTETGTGWRRWHLDTEVVVGAGLVAADGLVAVFGGDGHLRALDTRTGSVVAEFRIPALGRVVDLRRYGDALGLVTEIALTPVRHRLDLVDLTTGAGIESLVSHRVVLAESGPVVVAPGDGLWGLEIDGTSRRWELPLDGRPAFVGGVGDRVVLAGGEASIVFDASTGRPVDAAPASLELGPLPRRDALLLPAGTLLTYVGGDGVVWSAGIDEGGCCRGASLTGDRVTVLLLGGDLVTFDRADGTRRTTRPSGVRDAGVRGVLRDGDVLLTLSERSPRTLHDAVTGVTLASAPMETRALGTTGDGALVLVGRGWLAALHTPETLGIPRRYGVVRRCSDRAPTGCSFGG